MVWLEQIAVTGIVTVANQKAESPANAGQIRFEDFLGIPRISRVAGGPCRDCKNLHPRFKSGRRLHSPLSKSLLHIITPRVGFWAGR